MPVTTLTPTLTDEQQILFEAAVASDKMTDDPYVNWRVDMLKYDLYSSYDKVKELKAIKDHLKSGGSVLSIKSE